MNCSCTHSVYCSQQQHSNSLTGNLSRLRTAPLGVEVVGRRRATQILVVLNLDLQTLSWQRVAEQYYTG